MGPANGDAEMSFSYVMTMQGAGTCLNNRGQKLIDAAYRTVRPANSAPGFWTHS